MPNRFPASGTSAAMLTLFRADGAVDGPAMGRLGRWLMDQGCNGLLVFGTTGEGPSISVMEKCAAIRDMIACGVPAAAILLGAGAAALPDTIALTAAAGGMGCSVLVLPPFFVRNASRDGVQAWLDGVLRGTEGTPVYLYHFPDASGVTYDHAMIQALAALHPGRIAGVKDSTGDLNSALGWRKQFPSFTVYCGDDQLLRPLLAAGGAGAMTATAGLAPALVAAVHKAAQINPATEPAGEARLSQLWRDVLLPVPVTEAIKALFAALSGDERWLRMRPPLMPLTGDQAGAIRKDFTAQDDGAIAAAIRAMPPIFS